MAIEALSWMELSRINEQSAIRRAVGQLKIRDKEAMKRGYELVFEATRRINALDYLIREALKPDEMEVFTPGMKSFLRLYTYVVRYEDVSFREAMEIADMGREALGEDKIRQVEHAILLIPHLRLDLPSSELKRLALKTFHPTWYVDYCIGTFGMEDALKILGSEKPPTQLRLNTLKDKVEVIQETLKEEDLILEAEELAGVYRVKETEEHIPNLRSYREGKFIIQDKASAYAVEVAAPEPGWTVLDVCAAPGVKTSHMAQLMENQGEIYSMDYSKRRMDSWRGLTRKMGVRNAKPVLGDAMKGEDFPEVKADLILVDPPCTGTGTFWRSPSAKWRITEASINRMTKIQWKILKNSAHHVKEGGYLLYSTCSITTEENEDIITRLIQTNPEFNPIKLKPDLGLPGLQGHSYSRRLYPHTNNCNGFFISKLKRE
jgi:16S rRNA (cytosine967-C5)-methyltransferase